MKKVMALSAVLCSSVLLAACSSNVAKTEDLVGHRFVLVSVDDQTLPNSIPPVIEFAKDTANNQITVTGKMCNNFRGVATFNNGIIQSNGLATTRMICSDTTLNMLDTRINTMFMQGATVERTGDQLILKTAETTLVYIQQDIKP